MSRAKCAETGCDLDDVARGGDYKGLCPFHAWQKWSDHHGWNEVECVMCELGRTCEVHGPPGDEP